MASQQAAIIGRRLRERREELGWTRRHLAHKTDGLATENDIYRWESGRHRPQDDTLAALARAMGRDYVWAMANDERKANGTPDLSLEASRLDRIETDIAQIRQRIDTIGSDIAVLLSERTLVASTRDILRARRQLAGEGPNAAG